MPKLHSHYYKKSKIQQLKSFCTVVECEVSITKASEKLNISHSSISLHIKSLEYDLGYNLLNRNGKKISINANGEKYYKEAKNALLAMDIAYNGKLNISTKSANLIIFKNKLANIITIIKKWMAKFLNKMLIKITIKRILIFLAIVISCILFYLERTNWWFDREIERLANPLLREVISKKYYRLDRNILCAKETMQIHYDFNEINLYLIDHKYDIDLINIGVLECPITQLRMNGEEKIDRLLFKQNNTKCDMNQRYIGYNENATQIRDIMKYSKVRFYNLYTNNACINNNIFLDNIDKYKGKIMQFYDTNNLSPQGWHRILKYKNYYYLLSITTGLQPDNKNFSQDHYLIFKKLTLDQLKTFDNGSYWKIIKEYNIKID